MSKKIDLRPQLSDYKYDFDKLLLIAQEDTSVFEHVIQIVYNAVHEKNSDPSFFFKKFCKQWDSFLNITIPIAITKATSSKCRFNCSFVVKHVIHILHAMGELAFNVQNYKPLLRYVQETLNFVFPSLTESDSEELIYLMKCILKCEKYETSQPNDFHIENFRRLSVIPTLGDLTAETPFLQPRLIDSDYEDVEHYIDSNFRLLREDLFYGYRKGIAAYAAINKKKQMFESNFVLLYKSAVIRDNPVYKHSGLLYVFCIEMPQIVDWESTKRMKPGNLLFVSKDNFRSIVFGSIKERSPSTGEGKECTIHFKIEMDENKNSLECNLNYTILEPDSYFESYRHILDTLKTFPVENLPLSPYLVKPKTMATKLSVGSVLEKDLSFSLDEKQRDAVDLALSSPVALIQGPPGTGKTYVGFKIVEQLLKRESKIPILVVCASNHTLDNFLEGVLNVTKKVIRVGFRSESTMLKPYFLHNLIHAAKQVFYQHDLDGCGDDIYETLNVAFNLMTGQQFPSDKLSIYRKIVSRLCLQLNNLQNLIHVAKSNFFHEEVLKEMLTDEFRSQLTDGDSYALGNVVQSCRNWMNMNNAEFSLLKLNNLMGAMTKDRYFNEAMGENEDFKSKNVWEFTGVERIKYFFNAAMDFLTYFERVKKFLEKLHQIAIDELNKQCADLNIKYLRNADVIGLTTTGAAKYRDVISILKPEIIIVEEASFVIEMQVIASMPTSIKKLILIGDHKQLKPISACHHLDLHFNLNVSLFERLFMNGFPSVTLNLQRRMHPSICNLLVPDIYPSLFNHSSVLMYDHIEGILENLFFVQHDEPEDNNVAEKSRSNLHEAVFLVSLFYYLSNHHNYAPHRITILTLYVSQQKLIQKILDDMGLNNVIVSTVDGYQGKENDIILVSFVRSNSKDQIGFLSCNNRICVSLSRARIGLYAVGNFLHYARISPLWSSLVNKLKNAQAFGTGLPLKRKIVSKVTDFLQLCQGNENGQHMSFYLKLAKISHCL